jgi:predicted phage tail protein
MRLIEIAIGVILLGGAAWTTVRTYKGRGISSILVLAFAVFLVALGLSFLFGAFGELVRNLRFGSEWLQGTDTKGKKNYFILSCINNNNHHIAR